MAKRLNSVERAAKAKKIASIKDGVLTFSLAITLYGTLYSTYVLAVG